MIVENLSFAAAAVGIQLAAVAAFPRNCQTGWGVVTRPSVEVQKNQWAVTRFEVAGNLVQLSERKDLIPIVRSPC